MSSFNITPFPPQTGIKRPVSIEGLCPYEDWLRQYFYPLSVSDKKRTSHERFVNVSRVRFEKPKVSDLAQ